MAVRTFEAIGCEGLARVDVFVTHEGRIMINEINTMPGFTPLDVSAGVGGQRLDYPALIDRLITLALRRRWVSAEIFVARRSEAGLDQGIVRVDGGGQIDGRWLPERTPMGLRPRRRRFARCGEQVATGRLFSKPADPLTS